MVPYHGGITERGACESAPVRMPNLMEMREEIIVESTKAPRTLEAPRATPTRTPFTFTPHMTRYDEWRKVHPTF
jgi:hypothetical protein